MADTDLAEAIAYADETIVGMGSARSKLAIKEALVAAFLKGRRSHVDIKRKTPTTVEAVGTVPVKIKLTLPVAADDDGVWRIRVTGSDGFEYTPLLLAEQTAFADKMKAEGLHEAFLAGYIDHQDGKTLHFGWDPVDPW